MKNVLIISYFAPPLNTASAVRTGKSAKYLPQFGWNPIILSVKEIDYYQKDEEIYPHDLNIIRTESFDLYRIAKLVKKTNKDNFSYKLHRKKEKITNFVKSLFPIDDKIGWMPFCYYKAKKIIYNNNIDIIFTSVGGVFHSAITAYFLSKKYKIPLILEFRDLWVNHPFQIRTYFNQKLNNIWEAKVINHANKIISLAPSQKEFLQNKYNLNEDKFEIITNGFDDDDFKKDFSIKNKSDVIIFTFCGSFYTTLTPGDLFNSLLLIQDTKQRSIIRFIGNFRSNFWNLKEEFEGRLKEKKIEIEVIPRLIYYKLLKELYKSDVLLLFLPSDYRTKVIYHAKFFDYLAVRKPILSFCPKDSDIENIIKKGNLGFTIESGNIQDGKTQIEKIIKMFKEGSLKDIHGSNEFINQFTRKKVTEKLAKVFDSVIK